MAGIGGSRFDVRRLAAIDMHGLNGTRTRARIILAEFVLGAVGGTALGVWVLVTSTGPGWTLFGLWLAGCGLNYVPLTIHAFTLRSPRALATELEGVDIPGELRYYTTAQVWVLVPLAVVVFALIQRRQTAPPPSAS
jgi:hypothetical protein